MKKSSKVKKFNRTSAHRDSMIKNLAGSLIHYEVITTTKAKAKALKGYFDKLMYTAKKNDENARRKVKSMLYDNLAVDKVFDLLIERFKDRETGFVNVTDLGIRSGDSSKMCEVSLVGGKKQLHIEDPKKIEKRKKKRAKSKAKKTKKQQKAQARASVKEQEIKKMEKKEEKQEYPEETKKQNLAQRLSKFLGLKDRRSTQVKPEDFKARRK